MAISPTKQLILKISAGNTKTGKIPAVSLPPIKSCGNCRYCRNKCYALKSYRMYPAVKNAWDSNYDLWKTSPMDYYLQLHEYLNKYKPGFFRYHVSGDIPDQLYLDMIKTLARDHKDTKFLVFTKMFDFDYRNIPGNLSVVFSLFPGMKKPRKSFPTATAINKGDAIPENSLDCPGNCETCGMCWNLKETGKNVYFHMH